MIDLSPAAIRLLAHLDAYPRWHSLPELCQLHTLKASDSEEIPALVARGLVFYSKAIDAVAITPSGSVIVQEFRE